MAMLDTIFALSTAPGRAGVAVVRVSGPEAWQSFARLDVAKTPLIPRQTSVRRIVAPINGTNGVDIDRAMVVGFRGPASFTGEDCIEYHVHGGASVIKALMEALGAEVGHRMALPGEFTRRAFENGKIDLTAAEAVADLIHAETESQRLQALAQMDGNLFNLYEEWKDRIAHMLALMEADLDFSDQDLPEDMLLKVRPDLADIRAAIRAHLKDGRRGEILRDGFRVVILGAPNAGKSSLLNVLAQRDVAIVSPVAGTTRDMIDVHLNLGGYAVILTDTAGLRDVDGNAANPHDMIEAEGMRRALARAAEADLKLLLVDGTLVADDRPQTLMDGQTCLVLNKCDSPAFVGADGAYAISAKTGQGIDQLVAGIAQIVADKVGSHQAGSPALTRARHREALNDALDYLDRAVDAPLPELAAEDLRLALRSIGSITGRVDIEQLLDMIFRDFCIGK